MEYAIISLLSIAIILLIVSFVGKDRIKKVEEQIDQLSLSVLQETYIIKKKLKILEEELLTDDLDFDRSPPMGTPTNQSSILTLYEKGFSYEEIAQKESLPIEEVRMILEQARKMGLS